MLAKVYIVLKLMLRWKTRLMSHMQLAHLKSKGMNVGKNVTLGHRVNISLGKGATIDIGNDVMLDNYAEVIVEDGAFVEIGNNVYIGKRSILGASKSIKIGNDCSIAHNITIIDIDHKFSDDECLIREQAGVSQGITVGNDVWLATGVTMLKGVELGNRSVVGAGSVVTKSFPGKQVLAGVPAQMVRNLE